MVFDMNIHLYRKYGLAGILVAMLLLLMRYQPTTPPAHIAYIPPNVVRRVLMHPAKVVSKAVSPETSTVAPLIRKKPLTEEEVNALGLRSTMRDFTYVYKGKVLCAGAPCAADLELVIDTTHHPDTHLQAQTAEDGTYSIKVTVREDPHEQIDWKLMARGSNWLAGETHGRRILMDDPNAIVDDTLKLQ